MMGCRPVSTPMDLNLKLFTELGELLSDASAYQRLVGCLIYFINTRPYIIFAVSVVSQFMHALVHLTLMLFIKSFDILRCVLTLGYSILQRLKIRSHASHMRIMQGQKVTDALPLDSVHSMAATFYHEK